MHLRIVILLSAVFFCAGAVRAEDSSQAKNRILNRVENVIKDFQFKVSNHKEVSRTTSPIGTPEVPELNFSSVSLQVLNKDQGQIQISFYDGSDLVKSLELKASHISADANEELVSFEFATSEMSVYPYQFLRVFMRRTFLLDLDLSNHLAYFTIEYNLRSEHQWNPFLQSTLKVRTFFDSEFKTAPSCKVTLLNHWRSSH
ncbi:MAG: hypothetical protein H6626_09575 [Pseudobdellovibrionaceae bacterium]|nr:MAG: hypothetical protein H6626_09575 [Pseudobdellovibrionaceae bacterium]